MNVVRSATRIVARAADATVATAGAVSGAAMNGVVGGVRGAVNGLRDGATGGSHSTPAAVLTLAAVGAAGLVEWPLLVGIGGTALVVHRLNQGQGRPEPAAPRLSAVVDDAPSPAPADKATPPTTSATKAAPRKTATKAAPRKAARKTAPSKK